MTKTHYDLLGLEPTADADTIKKAFRREIARYHPDKVVHLGAEFQDLAAARAAELTVAYKTLTDAALRSEYDAALAIGVAPPSPPPSPASPEEPETLRSGAGPGVAPPTVDDTAPPPIPGAAHRFAPERASRDQILKRAIASRVLGVVEHAYGKLDTPNVRGFDLAIVPLAKPRFFGAPPPRVLIRIADVADGAAVAEAHAAASRTRVHAGQSPVVVFLFAPRVAAPSELSRAFDALARQPRMPDAPAEVAVIPVDVADWSCRLPPNCSAVVKKLADLVCG